MAPASVHRQRKAGVFCPDHLNEVASTVPRIDTNPRTCLVLPWPFQRISPKEESAPSWPIGGAQDRRKDSPNHPPMYTSPEDDDEETIADQPHKWRDWSAPCYSNTVDASKESKAPTKVERLPECGQDHVIYSHRRVVTTLALIAAGWTLLTMTCFGFKWIAIRIFLRAPDRLAEYVKSSPTASNQWFTFIGVLLGEMSLVLWGYSISYVAFRRLAYGTERTELMTYAAWSEMGRANYTLSRRKPLWPLCTIVIFIGNTFLPAGFQTLLSPRQIVYTTPYVGIELDQLSPGFASAIGFLPSNTFPNSANVSCGAQFVSNFWTFASHPNVIFDPCPSLDDIQTLVVAGRARLEASIHSAEPILSIPGSLTYVGGTGGTASLGPLGILPWGDWRSAPRHSPTPRGYNYTYTLNQQGMTVDVDCWRPRSQRESSILTTQSTNIPHLLRLSLQCGTAQDESDVSYHYIGSSSIIVKGCAGKNAQRQHDADTTVVYFKDAGASIYGTQGSELGGDLLCELRPKWTRNIVSYDSHRNFVRVNVLDDPDGIANRLTGFHGELGPGQRPFSPKSEESKRDFFPFYTRLLTVQGPLTAVLNAFVLTGSLGAVLDGAHGVPRFANATPTGSARIVTLNRTKTNIYDVGDLEDTVLYGKNMAIQSLASFNAHINSQNARTWIQPEQVETFIKGVFEYAATSQREWFQHYAVDGGSFNGPISVDNGTGKVTGVWRQETLGWGSSLNNSNSFVFYSLIPFLCFALISLTMIAWSQWYDAPRGGIPYAPDIDPTDWLQAVVASAQGGLKHAFPPDVLSSKQGLLEARKVRVRLGQIIDEEDDRPRFGFVCVD